MRKLLECLLWISPYGRNPCGEAKPRPLGQPGLAWPGLAWPGRGWPGSKLTRKSKKHKWSAWPGQAVAGRGQNWQSQSLAYNWPALAAVGGAKNWSSLPRNLDQPGQDQITGHAYLFRVYLEWSVL